MSEEKIELVNNKSIKIDAIMQYNENLLETITEELSKYKENDKDMDEATLLILEKQIGIINYIKRLNDAYKKVLKRIEKDAKSGEKTTLKNMKKASSNKKNTKKPVELDSASEDEAPKKKPTNKKGSVGNGAFLVTYKDNSDAAKKKKTTAKKVVTHCGRRVKDC